METSKSAHTICSVYNSMNPLLLTLRASRILKKCNSRSSGPGGLSPFLSGGMRLLCSQEFIWEIELTQFIRDLKAKWKWLAFFHFFDISVQFHGIWPFKNNQFSCLAISRVCLQSSSELRSKVRMTCTFKISVPFCRTWPFQNQFN